MMTFNQHLLLERSWLVVLFTFVWGVAGVSAQSLLQITTPSNGTVVQQGQTISVAFTANPSVSDIAISAGFVGGWVGQISGPGTYSLTIPSTTPIEQYQLTVIGTAAGKVVTSPSVSLVIDTPLSIAAVEAKPGTLQFDKVGDTLPLLIIGILSDGSLSPVTYSKKISFSSSNQNIVTIDDRGNATAVGAGSAIISILGGLSPCTVYVFVPPTASPVIFFPSGVNFGKVPLNQTKKEVLTLENNGTTRIEIGTVSFINVSGNPADFSIHRYCGESLPAGHMCTIAVFFNADTVATDTATLNIVTNAPGSPLQVSIMAAGIK